MHSNVPRIRAIPTTYRGIQFRSRLEANVARLLDAVAIPWSYEQEGYDLDGVRYLPDFFLPAARQFVEVKGEIEDPSVEKCIHLAHALQLRDGVEDETECARPARVVVLAQPFVRRADEWGESNEVFGIGFNGVEQVDALLVECGECGARFFMTAEQGWTCSACGVWSREHSRILVSAEHVRGETRYQLVESVW